MNPKQHPQFSPQTSAYKPSRLERPATMAGVMKIGAMAALLASPLVPMHVYAQGTTASVGGTVTDATGAVIPNAAVSLKNEQTGDVRNSVSNGSGIFSFSGVPIGNYDISIKATGFTNFQENAIHLDPGDQRTVRDIKMEIGASDVVSVQTGNQEVNIDSGEQSSLISAQDIQHLSVEGRDVTELFKILPGFAISGGDGSVNNRAFDPSQVSVTGALGSYAANGTPLNGVALLSDGADITDPGNFGGAMQTVNYEQVAEVKVQTSSFGADTARGPVVVNAVGKSGGEKYHGSLYTFARTSQLDSNDWIANHFGAGKAPDREVYPGGTIGGPIRIPGTNFNASRKLTFFVGGEQYAQRNVYAYGNASSALLQALVPTAGMRNGDFSAAQLQQYLGPAYTPSINGCPGQQDQNLCTIPTTGPAGQQVVNGNIGAYLDPVTKLILSRMPLPNVASNGSYNYITNNLVDNDLWQARGRVDDAISDRNKFFANYSIQRGVDTAPQSEYYSERGTYLGGINVPGGGLLSTIDSQIASLNLTTIFSATLTNEFYGAGAYLSQQFAPKNLAATQGNTYGGVYNTGSTVTPTLEDYNADGLPLTRLPDGSFGPIYAKKAVRTVGDNLTKVLGKHTVRTGMFYQLDSNHQVIPNLQTNGTVNLYYFGETFTDPVQGVRHDTGVVGSGSGGNYLANFAEGFVGGYSQANSQPAPNLYFYNLDGYIQDHWRVLSRLSLDGGIRFEHFTPWGDSHGLGIPVFSDAAYHAGTNPIEPGFSWHAIDPTVPVQGLATRWAYVEPRVGFSWDVYGGGKTILRGGYGIYRAHDSFNDIDTGSGVVLGLRTRTVGGPIALSSVSSQAGAVTGTGFNTDSSGYGFYQNDSEQPRVRTWNVAVDQRLPANIILELAYVGNISDKILNDGSSQNGQNTALDDLNSLPIGSLFQPVPVNDRGVEAGHIYPILAPPGQGTYNYTVGGIQQNIIDAYKKYDLYNHVYVAQHNIYANYHGLQAGIAKQTGKSIFSVNYTFSKALGVLGAYGNGYAGDPFNANNDYQPEAYDHRHIFNAAYSYQFGDLVKSRLVGIATNGWEVSGISNYQSGAPLAAINNSNFGLSGTLNVPVGFGANPTAANTSTCAVAAGSTAATIAAGCQIAVNNTNILGTPDVTIQPLLVGSPQNGNGLHQYVNGSAFAIPNFGTNGAYRLGPLAGPGFFNTDLTLAKRFKVTEGSSFQLRAAAFNFINHANNSFTPQEATAYNLNFSGVSSSTDSGTAFTNARNINNNFGSATLREGRRVMELGLRYDF